jgi:hypothetical protein
MDATGKSLAYIIRVDIDVPCEATDALEAHLMIDQEIIYCVAHNGAAFNMKSALFGISCPKFVASMDA